MICRVLVPVASLFVGLASCDWVRDSAGLTAELEARYPGSMIEIHDDRREQGSQRVTVRIAARSFEEDLNVAEEAREVAETVRRRYELTGPRDTVQVGFRSEERVGPFASSREVRFVFPASELNGD